MAWYWDEQGDKRLIMGILNVTPDSFSDGGQHLGPAAVEHARRMVADGAAIVDVGGESTRPGSQEVSAQEELARVLPVVQQLVSEGIVVSIDTRHATVAKACVEAGASIINDISGFREPAMQEVARGCDAGLVVMHMQGEPGTMQDAPRYSDGGVVADVSAYLQERAEDLQKAGVDKRRICLDPGLGFGKTYEQNLELMAGMPQLAALGYPLMLAASRKTFLGQQYGQPEPWTRVWSSVAAAVRGVEAGALVLRVHDVREHAEALRALDEPARFAFIALGCNDVDDRVEALRAAAAAIDALPYTQVTDVSQIYESEPAYFEDQAAFANAVLRAETRLCPRLLLQELQGLEWQAGRRRSFRNAPRPLDLDILDYEGVVSNDPVLTLPHPKQLERDFAMIPFMEIAPEHLLANGSPLTRDGVAYGKVTGVLGRFE